MSHDPHPKPGEVLHDDCAECESLAVRHDRGIGALDDAEFARAWRRAAEWNRGHITAGYTELPLLSALWAVQVQLERRGIPIGQVPNG